jgi:aminomethyltransferase
MKDVFGDWIEELKLFKCQETILKGNSMVIARSGWSPERGYEIYLRDIAFGSELYELMMQAGQKYGIKPGVPNTIRRIEGGMLSFGADMDEEYNVMELGLPEAWSGPDKKAAFLGKEALQRLVDAGGPSRKVMGLYFVSESSNPQPVPLLSQKWPVFFNDTEDKGETECGFVTSACYSPGMNANIAIATLWGVAISQTLR